MTKRTACAGGRRANRGRSTSDMRLSIALGCLALAPFSAVAQHDASEVKSLIAVLQRADASQHDKARACQQLGEFGTKEAVPALAALLSDQGLAAYARSGLEGIPDPSASAALRAALATLTGDRLKGVINSLGTLRDAAAVPALTKLAANPQRGVINESLLALGRVSNTESIRVLRRALASGPESSRPEAAAGCLIAAGLQMQGGNGQIAVTLYDAVREASVPPVYRLAATSGAIAARKTGGIALLVDSLKSGEREVRNVALLTVRRICTEALAGTLIVQLASAAPELQSQILAAISDCHTTGSVEAVRAKATGDNTYVRQAAFVALGKLGDASDAGLLLKGLLAATTPAESAAAIATLARLRGAAVDDLILRNLAGASDGSVRVALIDLLDARSPLSATRELLKQAADSDPRVSLAAFRAMRSVVGFGELPGTIALAKAAKDGPRRAAAEAALFYASTRSTDTAPAGDMLLRELKQSSEDLDKASWIRTLSTMGYSKALPAIASSLHDPNSWLVNVTIDNLSKWPGPAPIDELLSFVEGTPTPGLRERALTGAVQLAAAAGNGRLAPPSTVTAWFQRAGRLVRTTGEKRIVLSALGRWTEVESIRLLVPYLDDPEVKTDAASALVTAAAPVALGPHYAILEPILPRLSSFGGQFFTDRINLLKRSMLAAEAEMKAGKATP